MVGCFFQAGFQAVPFNSGGVWGWTSPFIKWGGFGSTSPFIEWGGFGALSLRGKTPPLNEGGAFQNRPASTVAKTWVVCVPKSACQRECANVSVPKSA